MLCLYFYLFFQKGILFHNAFLVQDKKDNAVEYKGKIDGSDIKVTVIGDIMATNSSTITYVLKDKYSYIYEVNITENFQDNRDIKILENNLPKFIGKYKPTNTIIVLWELNGDPVIELDYHDDFYIATQKISRIIGGISIIILLILSLTTY